MPFLRPDVWGRTPRERLTGIMIAALICVSPAPMIYAIDHYRFLDDRTFEVWVAANVVAFALSFGLIPRKIFPAFIPASGWVLARAGWSLGAVALCTGLVGIVNGALDSSIESRDVPVLGKRATLQRIEANRIYYVESRPLPGSDRVIELAVPRDVFMRVRPGESIRLKLGTGTLGIEWIRGVELGSMRPA